MDLHVPSGEVCTVVVVYLFLLETIFILKYMFLLYNILLYIISVLFTECLHLIYLYLLQW